MKILHTADWHLGHRLHEQSQFEEQSLFLAFLQEYIVKESIDLLLISGDIFDTGVPSSQSLKMYYEFLMSLRNSSCKNIVITGGNHDSPGTLNAPKSILSALNVHVVGKATEYMEDEIFRIQGEHENVIIAAVPYLRDQDIRRALAGESFDELSDRYKKALTNHYEEAAQACEKIKTSDSYCIAMGHLFAVGGSVSDSEQSIYVGNLGHIGANDFPEFFDYIALGHLHRAQIIGGKEHIRYSGSPVILSFSEVNHSKKMVVLETQKNKLISLEEVEIPQYRKIIQLSGDLENCIAKINEIGEEKHALRPWIEVILNPKTDISESFTAIYDAAKELPLDILKVSYKKQVMTKGIEQLNDELSNVSDLDPITVFKMRCDEKGFDLSENKDILDAFHEIVSQATENETL